MNRKLISKKSITINAIATIVWNALVNPNIIKKYFFGAEVITNWKEGSPITFRGEFHGN